MRGRDARGWPRSPLALSAVSWGSLVLDSKGSLYTTEGSDSRVQKFTPAGKFLVAWGNNEVKPGSFGGTFSGCEGRKVTLPEPVALCIDKHERVWVCAGCGRIQQFTTEGEYVGGFGSEGPKRVNSLPHTG